MYSVCSSPEPNLYDRCHGLNKTSPFGVSNVLPKPFLTTFDKYKMFRKTYLLTQKVIHKYKTNPLKWFGVNWQAAE